MQNVSERVQPAAAGAAHQLVIGEGQRTRNNSWQRVLTSGCVSCVMTVARLALHPREHGESLDIVVDRVHEESALRPRLVQLRVHDSGVHASVQELLVEPHCLGELQMALVVRCVAILFASIISVCHHYFSPQKRN